MVGGARDRGISLQCNPGSSLGTFERGMAGPNRRPPCTMQAQLFWNQNAHQANQSPLPPCLTMLSQKNVAGWGLTGTDWH